MNSFTKLTIILLIVAGGINITSAQIYKKLGGNPFTLNSQSAALELESTTKGFLPPKMTTANRDAINTPVGPGPATGLLIYNTTTNSIEVNTGTPGSANWKTTSVTTTPAVATKINNYNLAASDDTILMDPSADGYFSDQPDHVMYVRLPEGNSVPRGRIYTIGKSDETSKPIDIFPPIWLSKTTSIPRINIPTLFRVQYDGTKWYIID